MIDALAFTALVATPVLLVAAMMVLVISGGDFPRHETLVVKLMFAWTAVTLALCAYAILSDYWSNIAAHGLTN